MEWNGPSRDISVGAATGAARPWSPLISSRRLTVVDGDRMVRRPRMAATRSAAWAMTVRPEEATNATSAMSTMIMR